MIVTISGRAGAGKSTAARNISKKLKLKHYSSGDFMRLIAKERGVSLLELSKLAEKDKTIDKEIDKRQIDLGKKEKTFVIDGRLSAHFIPHSIKIFLECDIEERAKRIVHAKRDDEKAKTIAEAIKMIKKREKSEIKRYKDYYRYNPYELEHYDLVVDTTSLEPKNVCNIIAEFLKEKNTKKKTTSKKKAI